MHDEFADTNVRLLKIGRTSMIWKRLITFVSQNFDVLSTFWGRKYVRLDVIQNIAHTVIDYYYYYYYYRIYIAHKFKRARVRGDGV